MDLNKKEGILYPVGNINLQIRHPDKLYWPEAGITKLDLIEYYDRISKIILPHLKKRPVTLHYFPRGIKGFSYYRRDFTGVSPPFPVRTWPYQEKSQRKNILLSLIDSKAFLIWLASNGCLEFHTWQSKIPDIDIPDQILLDLDISKNTPFKKVLEAALLLKEHLETMNLQAFPKTSGGSGIHLHIPVASQYDFKTLRNRVKKIVSIMASKYPQFFCLPGKDKKTHSGSKVHIDYLQNSLSRNTITAYSARAVSGARVATPLTWKEVEDMQIHPSDFTIKNIPERIRKNGDLFKEVLNLKQEL